jgi:chromosome segregation ATPase
MDAITEIIDISDDHEKTISDLRETIAGYISNRNDLLKEIAELRQRNAAFAAEVQKLQRERDVAKRDVVERATVEQSLRAEITGVTADYREAKDEAATLRADLSDARFALAEMAQAFAEARSDARLSSGRLEVRIPTCL